MLERRGVDPAFFPQNFHYESQTNTYTCPAGQELPYQTTEHDRVGVVGRVIRRRPRTAQACISEALLSGIGRKVVRSENVPG